MDHALNNREIASILARHSATKNIFKGFLHPRDKERPAIKTPSLYVINTDYITGPGLHWVLILYQKNTTIFFDPFGLSPDIHNFQFVTEHSNNSVTYNIFTVQNFSSRSYACGHFVITYGILLCKDYSLKNIEKLFTKDKELNDRIAIDFVSWLSKNMNL